MGRVCNICGAVEYGWFPGSTMPCGHRDWHENNIALEVRMESGALPSAQAESTPPSNPPSPPKDRKLTQYVVFIWKDDCLRPLLAPDGSPAKWGAGNAPAAISKALGQEGPTITEQYGPKGTAIAVPASNLHSQPFELAPPAGWDVKLG